MAWPDVPSSPFVDRVDHQQCSRAGGLRCGFEGADELLRGQTGQVQLLKRLGPGRIVTHEPLAHQKHRWTAPSDALPCNVTKQVSLASACDAAEEHQRAARDGI